MELLSLDLQHLRNLFDRLLMLIILGETKLTRRLVIVAAMVLSVMKLLERWQLLVFLLL